MDSTVILIVFIVFACQPIRIPTLMGAWVHLNGIGDVTIGLNFSDYYRFYNNIGRFGLFSDMHSLHSGC